MEVALTLIGIFLANAALICWFRSESRSDWRHMDAKVDKFHEEMKDFRENWLNESKDFHNRLYKLEEEKVRLILREK